MRIAIGADHAGYPLNERIIAELSRLGHDLIDFGTHYAKVVDDYPDFAKSVGEAVQTGTADIGILVCGSGVGAAVAANKMLRIRAAACSDTYSGHQCREHDDCNVLCLGARVIGEELALEIVRAFIAAEFTGEERHLRRLAKIAAIEEDAANRS